VDGITFRKASDPVSPEKGMRRWKIPEKPRISLKA
jgi:hypothetical protein